MVQLGGRRFLREAFAARASAMNEEEKHTGWYLHVSEPDVFDK